MDIISDRNNKSRNDDSSNETRNLIVLKKKGRDSITSSINKDLINSMINPNMSYTHIGDNHSNGIKNVIMNKRGSQQSAVESQIPSIQYQNYTKASNFITRINSLFRYNTPPNNINGTEINTPNVIENEMELSKISKSDSIKNSENIITPRVENIKRRSIFRLNKIISHKKFSFIGISQLKTLLEQSENKTLYKKLRNKIKYCDLLIAFLALINIILAIILTEILFNNINEYITNYMKTNNLTIIDINIYNILPDREIVSNENILNYINLSVSICIAILIYFRYKIKKDMLVFEQKLSFF